MMRWDKFIEGLVDLSIFLWGCGAYGAYFPNETQKHPEKDDQ